MMEFLLFTHTLYFYFVSSSRGGSRISQRWAPTPKWGCQPIIQPNFPENCLKIKKIGSGVGGVQFLLCRSATAKWAAVNKMLQTWDSMCVGFFGNSSQWAAVFVQRPTFVKYNRNGSYTPVHLA